LSKKKIKKQKKYLNNIIGKTGIQYIFPFSKLYLQERYCTLKNYKSFLNIMKDLKKSLEKDIYHKIILQ